MPFSVIEWCESVARWQFSDLRDNRDHGPLTFLLFYRGRSRGDKTAINNVEGTVGTCAAAFPFVVLYA